MSAAHPEQAPHSEQAGTGSNADLDMARAEEIVDRVGERIGYFASVAGRRIRWAAARAREEAEDILAEAQHLRHNGQA